MIIALDIEGTLVSNGVSQIPRPGLLTFLSQCRALASRVVVFTSLPEERFRALAMDLVQHDAAPSWLVDVEYVRWSGPYKRLTYVAGNDQEPVVLVDDMAEYIHPADRHAWIQAPPFLPPYADHDRGLDDVLRALVGKNGKLTNP